jgi:hypothetical protein
MSRLALEGELLTTPHARARLDAAEKPFDLVSARAQAAAARPLVSRQIPRQEHEPGSFTRAARGERENRSSNPGEPAHFALS